MISIGDGRPRFSSELKKAVESRGRAPMRKKPTKPTPQQRENVTTDKAHHGFNVVPTQLGGTIVKRSIDVMVMG